MHGRVTAVWPQRIAPGFAEYKGSIFEDIARAHTWLLGTVGNLPFSPDSVGSWWDGQEEIDVVAVNHGSREAHLAECKWSGGPLHPRALDELRRKAAYFHARTGHLYRRMPSPACATTSSRSSRVHQTRSPA